MSVARSVGTAPDRGGSPGSGARTAPCPLAHRPALIGGAGNAVRPPFDATLTSALAATTAGLPLATGPPVDVTLALAATTAGLPCDVAVTLDFATTSTGLPLGVTAAATGAGAGLAFSADLTTPRTSQPFDVDLVDGVATGGAGPLSCRAETTTNTEVDKSFVVGLAVLGWSGRGATVPFGGAANGSRGE